MLSCQSCQFRSAQADLVVSRRAVYTSVRKDTMDTLVNTRDTIYLPTTPFIGRRRPTLCSPKVRLLAACEAPVR